MLEVSVRIPSIGVSGDNETIARSVLAALPLTVFATGDNYFREVLEALPAAIYMTDAAGRIIYFNQAAATLWGRRPELGTSAWCGSWKLFGPDGKPLPHDQCPMAVKERGPIRDLEAVAERPDETRVRFIPFPTPLYDGAGNLAGAVNMLVDITERDRAEQRLRDSEARYREIFDNARVAVWEVDFSEVAILLEDIRAQAVTDLRAYFQARPDRLSEAVRRVRIKDVNAFALELFEADRKATLLRSLADIFVQETAPVFIEELLALWEGRRTFGSEAVVRSLKGRRLDVAFTIAFEGDHFERTLVSVLDITAQKAAEAALRRQTNRLETLNRIARAITSDLNLERIVQTVTDAATELSNARFGAFFYNVIDDRGERYTLYALSGASRAAFDRFGLPGNSAVFDATFRGAGIVRSDDIRSDPRYGKNAPHFGTPMGHLPVVSYLAVPVVSRSGEVRGGLFLGHDQPAVFTPESEEIVAAIAAHAAIAIDNASLLQTAQSETAQRHRAEEATQRLAAIVESSDDAILAKDLDGTIISWNRGAERLFGYTAAEVIGKPVTILIPLDRHDEEPSILARIRRGERIDHYETIRRRKDGSLVEISLTVSPVKNAEGKIVGASKIARDITERRRAQEQQRLLLREMDHRVKNLFTLSSSIVSLSARSADTPQGLVSAIQGRLGALARAHALTLSKATDDASHAELSTTLHALIRMMVSPYDGQGERARVIISGPDVPIAGASVTSFALLLHEFVTNAAKYGALSMPSGHIDIRCLAEDRQFILTWREHGGPRVEHPTDGEGFGSFLARATVKGQLGGEISRDWKPEGLTMRLSVARDRLSPVASQSDG
jgi:PAS domain S-box-containing protein